MQLVNRDGQSYFVPMERDSSGISNFNKWEQAFRIFMNVFTQAHPTRATELIQYNHVIFTAASSYQWDNVYMYDKEFRMHMSNFPGRNWSVILQQAWTMYFKDRLKSYPNRGGFGNHGFKKKKDECRRFNKGTCTTGASCRYDHRCTECGKFGHGAHICRRRLNKQGSNSSNSSMTHRSVGNSQVTQESSVAHNTSQPKH